MIAYFKKFVEFKMGVWGSRFFVAALFGGGVFAFLASGVPAAYAETEEVEVISRKPDKANPLYETDEVEGGVFFYAPKGMTFVKKDGVIGPIDPEEFLLKKMSVLAGQIEALNRRMDVLERNVGNATNKKNQESL